MDEELVRIGKAAKILGVVKKTLQRYDKLGVLKPDVRLPSLGCRGGRLYSKSKLEEFKRRNRED